MDAEPDLAYRWRLSVRSRQETSGHEHENVNELADPDIIAHSLEEPALFGVLFRRHSATIFRYIARRIGAESADDVMSETFITAFQHRGRFDSTRDDARPWLFGIATTLIHRHRAAEARVLRSLRAAGAAYDESDDAGQSVLDRLDAQHRIAGLAPAIRALPRRDRDTLLLYAWAELGYDGIATALDVPVGTVRSRLNRVRRKLAAAAAEIEAGDGAPKDMKGANDGHSGRRA